MAQSATPAVYARSDVLVNNMRAGALDKVVYEAAAAGLPVVVASEGFEPLVGGIEPPLRFAQDDAAALADRVCARCTTLAPERRRAIGARAARAGRARPLGRALGRARGRGGAMTQVLHVQKVSGVSGSEAHLLSLLPLLRERGWDARMLVLHEGEPGAREFVARMSARGVPDRGVAHALRSRSDGAGAARAPTDRTILHTHLVHARRARPAGGEPSRGYRCG